MRKLFILDLDGRRAFLVAFLNRMFSDRLIPSRFRTGGINSLHFEWKYSLLHIFMENVHSEILN